ncbi:sigma-70 family RNA polymerase sigma factor [Herbivorax sp. ANBcel31]|uniref:sigma-70 family RNA polymerase sigma factor n=1 Tax=Herbivorax sp. ANBcel31 TaxID=3069754 RepID=UPI0027B8287E|nr:sigma-70 family RNA polymerase sigma factor [Herbivorax sp. ANBcel31]MDQ2087073.1 sigma-70 family RNA polymerase sigma factor [Herbivorax sp. ANBcel31]
MLFITAVINYTGETATRIVEKIKNGDKQLKEKLIKDYIPFILKIVSDFCSSNANDLKSSDEYSIGLIAFDEAIDRFDISRSRSFLKFAEMVMKKRMIDYFRKSSSVGKNEIPFSSFNSKREKELEKKLNMYDINQGAGKYELIWELKNFSKELESFGLSITKLPDYVPKHKDSKQMCIGIAKKIIENKDILYKLKTKKYIQMKQLSKVIDVHPKTVERNRAFIICLCIIYESDYGNFKAYLNKVF